ncbi:unnamed protein product [Phytophthora fragariaefolia]|uniref:Unnamed protein product n=1 Tax=Phytophthora fragariaefolia TaxID=1490495 RepID=A0A9W6WZ23_9STRA|nr:unnamed protein product [Phytophthora fragariaefolia]
MLVMPSLLFLFSVLVGHTNGEQCSTSEYLTIATNSNLEGCTSEVGFGGFSAILTLTKAQIQAVCDSSACMALMDDMRAMNFGNCKIEGTNVSLGTDILDPFAKVCTGSGSVDLSAASISDESIGSAASGSTNSASARTIGWVLIVLGSTMPSLPTFVVVSLTLVKGVIADEECSLQELMSIASNKNVAGCSKAAGFSSMSTISDLTPEQLEAVCGSSACAALMKDTAALELGNCRIPVSKIYLQSDIIDPFTERCSTTEATGSSSSSRSTASNLRTESSSSATNSARKVAFTAVSSIAMVLATVLIV